MGSRIPCGACFQTNASFIVVLQKCFSTVNLTDSFTANSETNMFKPQLGLLKIQTNKCQGHPRIDAMLPSSEPDTHEKEALTITV